MEKQWRPKIDEKFYYINVNEGISNWIYDGTAADRYYIKMGNCFKTEKEAQFELEKINFFVKMKEKFEPWKCDWENDRRKFSLEYDFAGKRIHVAGTYTHKTIGGLYTDKGEIAKEYGKNPDTAKYLFGIEPKKKYIVSFKNNNNNKLIYLKEITYNCDSDNDDKQNANPYTNQIDEINLTSDKQNAKVFTDMEYAKMDRDRCGSHFEIIEIKDKNE